MRNSEKSKLACVHGTLSGKRQANQRRTVWKEGRAENRVEKPVTAGRKWKIYDMTKMSLVPPSLRSEFRRSKGPFEGAIFRVCTKNPGKGGLRCVLYVKFPATGYQPGKKSQKNKRTAKIGQRSKKMAKFWPKSVSDPQEGGG